MGSRKRAREQALQVLYLIDLAEIPVVQALNVFRSSFESHAEDFQFVESLTLGVQEHRSEIDRLIEEHSQNWKLSRMPRIDRNILRLGTYELKYCVETPLAVVLDEAIELGKKFGESKTSSFINGILDPLSRAVR